MKKYWNKLLIGLFILGVGISCTKEDECIENRKEDCFCADIYLPVCGCNDITYSNACQAACAGIIDYTTGECQ